MSGSARAGRQPCTWDERTRAKAKETRYAPSWYSSADTHIFLNVLRPARIEPPIQVEYLRSGGALIRILVSRSASFLTSCRRRSPKPARAEEVVEERQLVVL